MARRSWPRSGPSSPPAARGRCAATIWSRLSSRSRRAAGQVRAQGRGSCAGKRPDDDRFQRRRVLSSCRRKPRRPPAGGLVGRLRRHPSNWRPRAGRALPASKQDFARLMLGLFAASFDGYPLTFTYVGQAEAPQGKADVLEARGPANFAMRLFVYRDTHLPVMVTWQGGPRPGRARTRTRRGGAPAAPAPGAAAPDQREAAGTSAWTGAGPRTSGSPPAGEPGRGPAQRRRKTGCISPTTVMSTDSSGRSGCAARSVPTPSKKPRSTASGPIRKSIRRNSRFRR